MTKKYDVLQRVSDEIENQARTEMFLSLKAGKNTFEKAAKGINAIREEELTTIIDYFRGKIGKEVVWNECEKFREQIIDRVVEQWREKRK